MFLLLSAEMSTFLFEVKILLKKALQTCCVKLLPAFEICCINYENTFVLSMALLSPYYSSILVVSLT